MTRMLRTRHYATQLVSALFFVSALGSFGTVQGRQAGGSGCHYRIPERPAVYVSLEKRRPRVYSDEPLRYSYEVLRFHNNSDCSIRVRINDLSVVPGAEGFFHKLRETPLPNGTIEVESRLVIPEDAAVLIKFDVQKKWRAESKPVNYYDGAHQVFTYEVEPGKSLAFAVRSDYPKGNWVISVPYEYAWENDGQTRLTGTIKHRVHYFSECPDGYCGSL